MDTSTHIEEYLQRLIEFKQTKDLHVAYIDERRRKELLKELTLSLGFEDSLWIQREQEAAYFFFIYDQIESDYNVNSISSKTYAHLCKHFLQKAINLDPFNEEYLQEYVKANMDKWKAEKFRKIQYLQLFNPASTESTSLQVDLSIHPDDMHLDYFTDEVIGPYVDAMVFLKDQVAHEKHFTSEVKLKELAQDAGIDSGTLGEVAREIEEMYKLVNEANDDSWLDWKKVHKAYLTADKMVGLAPYQPKILEAAIRFYGNTLWRVILDASRLTKKTDGYKEFCLAFYRKKRPNIKDKITAAQQSIDKAKELRDRYMSLPEKAFSNKSDEDRFFESIKLHHVMFRFKKFDTPMQVNAYVHAQTILHQFYHKLFKFKEQNFRFAVIVGLILYVGAALVCEFVFGNWLFIWTFIMVPGLAAAGIASLRSTFLKTNKIKINPEHI